MSIAQQLRTEPSWEVVASYHETTKHHFRRYARSPGFLDWANQPSPFRRFEGTELVRLPLAETDATPPFDRLFAPEPLPAQPVALATLGRLLQYSLAITAWKTYQGTGWALRANPSSGNLHPTECYLVLPAIEALGTVPAVYHYAPEEHGLERRVEFSADAWSGLSEPFPAGAFFVGLSSIPWREAWKYGERAYRYCQHDLGHALACLRIATRTLGWQLQLLGDTGDATTARLFGLDRSDEFPQEEREDPGPLAVVIPGTSDDEPWASPSLLPTAAAEAVAAGTWFGTASRLSRNHVAWPVIDAVAAACHKPQTEPAPAPLFPPPLGQPETARPVSAAQIIQQRRSAVAMDGQTTLSAEAFFTILSRTLPSSSPPWDAIAWPPLVHLGLFVHRVEGLERGLYLLARQPQELAVLRGAMRPDFAWRCPPQCPAGLELYQLRAIDVENVATQISCHQEIAGEGVFSVAMLARWNDTVEHYGSWFYRRMFWEAGMIGQMLYLEAEAAGIRGTGLGCFYDDPVRQVFGLREHTYQSLYHFTVGGAVEDRRLSTLPPYGHRNH